MGSLVCYRNTSSENILILSDLFFAQQTFLSESGTHQYAKSKPHKIRGIFDSLFIIDTIRNMHSANTGGQAVFIQRVDN